MNQSPVFVLTCVLGIILTKKVTIVFLNIYVDTFLRFASIIGITDILLKGETR